MSGPVAPRPAAAVGPAPTPGRSRFLHLPERIRLEDTVESHDPFPPADPTMGRDVERDAMLRVSGIGG